MKPEEAFIGILACAVAADNRYVESELNLIELVVAFHRYTKDLDDLENSDIVERVRANVSKKGARAAIEEYCDSLPTEWRGAAFLSALDLVFVDGNSHSGEVDCIGYLASVFGIDPDSTEQYIVVFKEKNGIV